MFGSRRFNVWRVAARRLGSKPVVRMVLACGAMAMWAAADMVSQDRASDMGGIRGDHAELSITIKENSSQLIGPLVTVKVYRRGTLSGQMTTSKGRTVFILNELGDYVITADAVGYRSAQKEISVPVAVAAEEEIVPEIDEIASFPSARDSSQIIFYSIKHSGCGGFCGCEFKNRVFHSVFVVTVMNDGLSVEINTSSSGPGS